MHVLGSVSAREVSSSAPACARFSKHPYRNRHRNRRSRRRSRRRLIGVTSVLLLALLPAVLAVLFPGQFAAVAAAVSSDQHLEATPIMPSITIGIAGGTGAGKTTLARAVYETLGGSRNVAYLSHDSYYRDITHLPIEERAKTNFDHPDSLDTELLIRHVQMLKRGLTVNVPNYDFSKHARTEEVTVVQPKKVVLVEGILIFSEENLVNELDVKVFVEADSDIRLMRRIARDTVERGRSVEAIMDQYVQTVRGAHEQFVEPSKRRADVIVHSFGDSGTGGGGGGDDEDDNGNGAATSNEKNGAKSTTSVALKMIVNHLMVEAGIEVDVDSINRDEQDKRENDEL